MKTFDIIKKTMIRQRLQAIIWTVLRQESTDTVEQPMSKAV
jgi:hypothetical protein